MDDSILMKRFREGDKEAFRDIYDMWVNSLTSYVRGMIFRSFIKRKCQWEDIVADCFVKLFNARERFESPVHIKKWLFLVANHAIIDIQRFEVANPIDQFDQSEEIDFLRPHPTDSIDPMLASAIEKLPRLEKKILKMYFFSHKTTQEVAETLGIASQTALNHKTHAINKLRKYLTPYKEYILI